MLFEKDLVHTIYSCQLLHLLLLFYLCILTVKYRRNYISVQPKAASTLIRMSKLASLFVLSCIWLFVNVPMVIVDINVPAALYVARYTVPAVIYNDAAILLAAYNLSTVEVPDRVRSTASYILVSERAHKSPASATLSKLPCTYNSGLIDLSHSLFVVDFL